MKEKNLRDVLNRLKWDSNFDFSEVEVVYVDRAIGLAKIYGFEIEDIGHKFLFLKGDVMIPMHRVVEVRHAGKVVWKKV